MPTIDRVFYHELGHFVAHQLNFAYYKGNGICEIKIYPCHQNIEEYCGHTKPIEPEGYDEKDKKPPPAERLAEYLARTVYGCMFQAYYEKSELVNCFKKYGTHD